MVPHWPDQPVDPGAVRLHGSDNHHDTFMTRLFPFLLLLLATPAAGQSFYPNLAGQRYCELRRLGVDKDQARRVSIREYWAPHRQSPLITTARSTHSLDTLDFARWVVQCDGN